MWILLIIGLVLGHIGLYGMFQKAGVEGWKALVPGYNIVVWHELIGRPAWRGLLLLIPIVNLFIFAGMIVDLVLSFDKQSFFQHFLAVAGAPFYFLKLGFSKTDKYIGKGYLLEKENPTKKGFLREWSEAIIFAVFAAMFIRMFLIEAYTIPTPSMEGSLLVGDYLFVSKANYGSRLPMTPLHMPLVHNKFPLVGGESYSEALKWPYKRLPGWQKIKRFDPVVFNFPEGDTIVESSADDLPRNYYYEYIRTNPKLRNVFNTDSKYDVISRPVDKMDNYVKRCVGLPGETLQLKNRILYIDGQRQASPNKVQYRYRVNTSEEFLSPAAQDRLLSKLLKIGINRNEITSLDRRGNRSIRKGALRLNLSEDQAKALRENSYFKSVQPISFPEGKWDPGYNLFPHDPDNHPWNPDNYGPIKIPAKGDVITLTRENMSRYKRLISIYEGNTFAFKNGQFTINGEQTNKYTIKQDYYFMLGDNRHNSEDSRFWGFVPFDHVVGKPLFIWFSMEGGEGIRWNRIFKSATAL